MSDKKLTEEMRRIQDSVDAKKINGIILPGKPVDISGAILEKLKRIPGFDISEFDFYHFELYPESLKEMKDFWFQFDLKKPVREKDKIPKFSEIVPALMQIECDGFRCSWNASQLLRQDPQVFRIQYLIEEMKEKASVVKKPSPPPGRFIKEGGDPYRKNKDSEIKPKGGK